MPLTESEIRAFKLQSFCFFYLPFPIPLKWSEDFTEQVVNTPTWKWTPWAALVLETFLAGLISLALVIWYGLIAPRQDIKVFYLVCTGILGIIACYTAIFIWIGLLWFVPAVSVFNAALKGCDYLEQRSQLYPLRGPLVNLGASSNNTGSILAAQILYIACAPFVFTIFTLYVNLDVTYYLLDEMLPYKMYWDKDTIALELLLRFGFMFSILAEMGRTLSYFYSLMLIFVDRVQKIIRLLIMHPFPSRDFIRCYRLIHLNFKVFQAPIEVFLYTILLLTFWMGVACIFVLVKLSGHLPLPILFLAGFIMCVLGLANMIAIPIFCGISSTLMGMRIINLKRAQFRFAISKPKRLSMKVNLKTCQALMPIKIRYGTFLFFDGDFEGEYIRLFLDRCFTALLSFTVDKDVVLF